MRILLIEDDAPLAAALMSFLETRDFVCECADSLAAARALLPAAHWAAVLLDWQLPDGEGLSLLPTLRRNLPDSPVIMLTARDQISDRIRGLDAGADDYLVKPFGSGELMARVRAQLRRSQRAPGAEASPVIQFGPISIDLARRTVERRTSEDGSETLHLTPIEYKLLTHLASQPDRVITHAQLLKAVWGPGHAEDTHYVRVHMANLRKKVEDNASMPRHLRTEAGIGYRFVP